MAHFDNPDPFVQAQEHNDDNTGHISPTRNEDAAPGRDVLSRHSSTSSSPDRTLEGSVSHNLETLTTTKSDDSRTSEQGSSQQQQHTLDKIATLIDNVQSGVKEKAKSAASKFHLESIHATSVSRFLNPTVLRMKVRYDSGSESDGLIHSSKEQELLWRARDNRKGRNSIAVPRIPDDEDDDETVLPMRFTPRMRANAQEIGQTIWRMLTTFPYWDMAFWSGWSYTLGSALFVATGVISWGPIAFGEGFETPSAETYGGPLTFFFGALLYQIGAVTAYLEAVNDGSFHGSAMRRLLEGHENDSKKLLDDKIHGFLHRLAPHRPHQGNDERAIDDMLVDPEAGWNTKELRNLRPGSIYPQGKSPAPRRGGVDLGGEEGHSSVYATWRWWPTMHALRHHHIYDIGWLACTIQLFGVTLYGITGVVDLPGVLSSLENWQKLGAFWVPQVVAALCFLIASLMFMLETQEKWWRLEPFVLGWWVGVWATIGMWEIFPPIASDFD